MTPCSVVYKAFLSKVSGDDWEDWNLVDIEEDMHDILLSALPYFKFPQHDLALDVNGENFMGDLINDEVQILATYMKCEWLNRNILSWENVRPMYDEKDWSLNSPLDKLRKMLELEQARAKQLESIFYRSPNKKPFRYRKLAG